jgi:hypothetical protein
LEAGGEEKPIRGKSPGAEGKETTSQLKFKESNKYINIYYPIICKSTGLLQRL